MPTVIRGEDGIMRCRWGDSPLEYRFYHDFEWGFPVADDRRLFEKLCLEGFQAGLSWLTILRKREAFRSAFSDFDFTRVARFTDSDARLLMGEAAIVRNRAKIEATITNAKATIDLVKTEGSLASCRVRRPGGRRPRAGTVQAAVKWTAPDGLPPPGAQDLPISDGSGCSRASPPNP